MAGIPWMDGVADTDSISIFIQGNTFSNEK